MAKTIKSLMRPELFWAAGGVVLGVAIYLSENYFKFGSPWINGYEEEKNFVFVPINYLLILVALGKGIFWYSPGLVLAPLALREIQREKPLSGSLKIWIATWYFFFFGLIAVYGSTYHWGGFHFWGNRYVMSVTIFCAVITALIIQQRQHLSPVLKWAIYFAFAFSILVNWIGETIGQRYYGECPSQAEECSAAWSTSPLYVFTKPFSEWLLLVQHRYPATVLIVCVSMFFLYRRLSPDRPTRSVA